jgi:hypothetical protein
MGSRNARPLGSIFAISPFVNFLFNIIFADFLKMLTTAGVVSDKAEDALREIKQDPPPHITPRILSRLLLICWLRE